MASIAMCMNPTCPVRETCARHEAGGAITSKNQQWLRHEPRYLSKGCEVYFPVSDLKAVAA